MPESPVSAAQLAIPYDLFCQECGYNLRGLTGERCPECGHPLGAVRSRESRIPWVHRDKLGRIRAYWKTVFWVGFQYKRFCEEMARPVSYADAQRFRWITIAHAYVPLACMLLAVGVGYGGQLQRDLTTAAGGRAGWFLGACALALLLFLVAATGVPSYLFDLRSLPVTQRNRAIALSYYCCGSLNWTPFLATLAVLTPKLVVEPRTETVGLALILLVALTIVTQIADWLLNLDRTAQRVMPQRPGWARWMVTLVPLLWLASAIVIVVGMALAAASVLWIAAIV